MSLIIPNTFATAATDLALSDLDENFTVLIDGINSNSDRLSNTEFDILNIKSGVDINEFNVTIEKDLILPEITTIPSNSTINGPVGSIIVPGTVSNCLQTVNTSVFSTTSTTPTDVTNLNVSITPKSLTNKILVLVDLELSIIDNTSNLSAFWRLTRNNTPIYLGGHSSLQQSKSYINSDQDAHRRLGLGLWNKVGIYLDTPNTLDEVVYQVQVWTTSTGTAYVNVPSSNAWSSAIYGSGASSITVLEIISA
jgi:hypothetical protein